MATFYVSLCAVTLGVVGANFGHHGCPFLKKVVPQGKMYMDVADTFRITDCTALAKRFKEHGHFALFEHNVTTQAEIEEHCRMEHPPPLKSVFPTFSTSDMLVEFQSPQQLSVLAKVHFCSKSHTITQLQLVRNTKSLAAADPKVQLNQLAEKFLKQVFEKYDCSVYADVVEPDVVVDFNGEPLRLTRDLETTFKSAKLAQSACEEKAAKEKRVHTSNSVAFSASYFDHYQKELTVVAERSVSVVFRPGVVRTHPIAITFGFSEAGKINAIRMYETEAMHIEEKWGEAYGQPSTPTKDKAPSPNIEDELRQKMFREAEDKRMQETPKKEQDEKPAKVEKVTLKSPSLIDVALSEISAATGAIGTSWPLMLLAVLSVGIARL